MENVENFEAFITILDFTLNSKRKRHIVGGILLSVSLLFGGLALTTMTLRTEEKKNE
ncbi:MAG: histidine kinase [Eubacterium sp.]|nr:histidine kinase [Eubacterium sp.]